MSKILPDPLAGNFSPDVVEVYKALKAIPDDDLIVWVSLPLPGSENRPHFLVAVENRCAILIEVCGAGQTEAEEAAGESLFSAAPDRPLPGMIEEQKIDAFLKSVGADASAEFDSDQPVRGLVLFPRVTEQSVRLIYGEQESSTIRHAGRELLHPEKLRAALAEGSHPPGVDVSPFLGQLRASFTPESVVPPHFSSAKKIDRRVTAELTPILLDFEQEQWAKNRLHIPEESYRVAEHPGAQSDASLVTGVAGSGKSLVLLFRACTQAKLDRRSRSLVLTHNRALKFELESRFGDLGRPRNVQWHTFFSWARELLRALGKFPDIVQYAERDALIEQSARAAFGNLLPHQVEFLRDEFDWLQDCGLDTRTAYMDSERKGRGVRLNPAQRDRVFDAFLKYREELGNCRDWSGLGLDFWKAIERGEITLPKYDFLYVDEAQFFAPVWFLAVKQALQPHTGKLLLAADPTQGFLKRRQSWLACGLDLRGRSTRLKRCYRSCREILTFAACFYRSRTSEEDPSELNLPGEEELVAAPNGHNPFVLTLSSKQDEMSRTANEVASYLKGGGEACNVLVLVADSCRLGAMIELLGNLCGREMVRDAREKGVRNAVRVCGVGAATGLESSIVFLVGLSSLIESENRLGVKEEQLAETIRDNTRKLYMAFTRAGWCLVITWPRREIPAWLKGCCLNGERLQTMLNH